MENIDALKEEVRIDTADHQQDELEPTVIGPISEVTQENGSSVVDRDNIVWGDF